MAGNSDQVKATRWSISRSKTKTGAVFPVRVTYEREVDALEVLAYCMRQKREGDKDFKPYTYFSVRPT